jgi:hypothetical protein
MPFFLMFNFNCHNHSIKSLIQISFQILWCKYVLSRLMTVFAIRILIELGLSVFSGSHQLQNLLEWWYCRNKVMEVPI